MCRFIYVILCSFFAIGCTNTKTPSKVVNAYRDAPEVSRKPQRATEAFAKLSAQDKFSHTVREMKILRLRTFRQDDARRSADSDALEVLSSHIEVLAQASTPELNKVFSAVDAKEGSTVRPTDMDSIIEFESAIDDRLVTCILILALKYEIEKAPSEAGVRLVKNILKAEDGEDPRDDWPWPWRHEGGRHSLEPFRYGYSFGPSWRDPDLFSVLIAFKKAKLPIRQGFSP